MLLDGIDEASDVKGVLQSYIMRRLVPMEISLVLTSRPEGVSADLSTLKQSFAIMSLKPLSDKQQKDIILNQELRMLECGVGTVTPERAHHSSRLHVKQGMRMLWSFAWPSCRSRVRGMNSSRR